MRGLARTIQESPPECKRSGTNSRSNRPPCPIFQATTARKTARSRLQGLCRMAAKVERHRPQRDWRAQIGLQPCGGPDQALDAAEDGAPAPIPHAGGIPEPSACGKVRAYPAFCSDRFSHRRKENLDPPSSLGSGRPCPVRYRLQRAGAGNHKETESCIADRSAVSCRAPRCTAISDDRVRYRIRRQACRQCEARLQTHGKTRRRPLVHTAPPETHRNFMDGRGRMDRGSDCRHDADRSGNRPLHISQVQSGIPTGYC